MQSDPPYERQGEPLPEGISVTGAWVIYGKVFIFRADPAGSLGEFWGLRRPDQEGEADGFDADMLAENLEISVDDLFQINAQKKLRVTWKRGPYVSGVDSTDTFLIQTPERGVAIDVSRVSIQGNA